MQKPLATKFSTLLSERQTVSFGDVVRSVKVNVIPEKSRFLIYLGKKLCDDQEVLLICKTTSEAFDSLIPVVQRIHLNENPEIISVGIVWWSCQVYGVD